MPNSALTVAILAGGRATRLRPLTETVPKSLLQVNGEPFAAHQLRLLQSKGIRRVVFCLGHLGESIQRTIGDGTAWGLQVDYSFDGPVLLGTAGAVKNALSKLDDTSGAVLVGDQISALKLLNGFIASGAGQLSPGSLAVVKNAEVMP